MQGMSSRCVPYQDFGVENKETGLTWGVELTGGIFVSMNQECPTRTNCVQVDGVPFSRSFGNVLNTPRPSVKQRTLDGVGVFYSLVLRGGGGPSPLN